MRKNPLPRTMQTGDLVRHHADGRARISRYHAGRHPNGMYTLVHIHHTTGDVRATDFIANMSYTQALLRLEEHDAELEEHADADSASIYSARLAFTLKTHFSLFHPRHGIMTDGQPFARDWRMGFEDEMPDTMRTSFTFAASRLNTSATCYIAKRDRRGLWAIDQRIIRSGETGMVTSPRERDRNQEAMFRLMLHYEDVQQAAMFDDGVTLEKSGHDRDHFHAWLPSLGQRIVSDAPYPQPLRAARP